MKKAIAKRGVGRPALHKPDEKPRWIRGIPDDVYRDFRVYCLRAGRTLGEELTALMRARIEKERERLELLVENIRGR